MSAYCEKINAALGLSFSLQDASMVFASERRLHQFVKREDVFNVLFDMQNVAPMAYSEHSGTSAGKDNIGRVGMADETRKTVRNILRETLRAEASMDSIRREFSSVRLALFEVIHGRAETQQYSSALTCGEMKKFFQVNGY